MFKNSVKIFTSVSQRLHSARNYDLKNYASFMKINPYICDENPKELQIAYSKVWQFEKWSCCEFFCTQDFRHSNSAMFHGKEQGSDNPPKSEVFELSVVSRGEFRRP
jgi:hypothetical protein